MVGGARKPQQHHTLPPTGITPVPEVLASSVSTTLPAVGEAEDGRVQGTLVGIDRKTTPMDTQIAAQFKRFQIIQEILNTEYLYVEDLKTLVKSYLTPIRDGELLPSHEIPQIFLNVEIILGIHSDLLQKLMKRLGVEKISPARSTGRATGEVVLETSSKGRSISYHVGDIFKEMSKNFVVYKHYCSNYKKSMDAIQRAKQIPAFADFLRTQSQKAEVNNLSLRDYMIKPIQRICKYPLLFKNLLQNTPMDHKDYRLQVECLETLEKMVTYINISRKEAENIHTMMIIETSMANCKIRLAEAGRHYKHEGQLAQLIQSGARVTVRQCYLFSDLFVIAKSKSKKASFLGNKNLLQFVAAIPLATATIKNVEDQKDKGRLNGFQIDGEQEGKKEGHTRKSFVFFARSAADRELWTGKIRKAIGKRTQVCEAKEKEKADKEKEKADEQKEKEREKDVKAEQEERKEVERLQRRVSKQRKLIESLKEFMESEFEEKKTMLTEIERLKQADLDRELEIKRLRDELAARDRQLLEVEERAKAAVAEAEERAKAAATATPKKNEDGGSQIIAVPPRPRLSVSKPAADNTPTTTTSTPPPPAILDEDAEKRGSMAFFKSMSQGVGKLLETEKAKFESERREREEREARERERDEVQAVRTRAIRADSILAEDEWIQKKTRVLSLEEMLDSDNEDDSSEGSDKKGGGPGQKQDEADEGDDDDDDDEADDEEEEGAIKQFYDEADTAKKEAGAEQREQAAEEVNLFEFIAEQGAALGGEKAAAGDKKDRKSKKKRFATPSKMWPFASKKSAPSSPGSTITSLPSPSPSPSPASAGGSTIVATSSHGVPTRVPPPVPARAPSVHLTSVSLSPSSSQEVLPVYTPAARPAEESSGDEESEGDVGDAELSDHLRDLRESNPDLTTRRTRASIMLFFGTK